MASPRATTSVASASLAVAAGASVAGVLCLAALWTAACGLSLEGLGQPEAGPGNNGTGSGGNGTDGLPDAPPDAATGDGPIAPPACAMLDAACLGALAPGWQPVGVTDAGCGSGYVPQTLRINPRVDPGGCACGPFQPMGSFTCGGSVIEDNTGCGNTLVTGALAATCVQQGAEHIEVLPPQASGSALCVASNDAGTGAMTDPLTLCVPGCSADYCSSSSRCILSQGQVACPNGFTLLINAGTGADPGCTPCTQPADSPGQCTGHVTVFDNDSCDGGGGAMVEMYSVGVCNDFGTQYASVWLDLTPPPPTCTSAAGKGETGDASLVEVQTICCQ